MTFAVRRSPALPAAQTPGRSQQGPALIDPQLLKLVSGGAPKGGWEIPVASSSSDAPKGGWA